VSIISSLLAPVLTPCQISLGDPGPGYPEDRPLHGDIYTICFHLLRRRGPPDHSFNMHDLLSVVASCEGSERITWRRICLSILHHSHAPRRIRATVHALWHYTFGDIWSRKLGRDGNRARVYINDGTLFQESCSVDLQMVLTAL